MLPRVELGIFCVKGRCVSHFHNSTIKKRRKTTAVENAFAFVGVEPTKKFFQEIFITEVTAVCTSVFACSIYHLDRICQEKFVALFVAHTAEFYKTTQNFTEFAEICKSAKKHEKT